jgi:transcriptional regulator with XRE-family HTH domain
LKAVTDETELNRKAVEIGERVRTFMRRKGMNHNELGKALGIGGNAVTQFLSGKGTVQYAKLSNLAGVLGVDPNAILGIVPGSSRELLLGAIEGALIALNFSQAEAIEIAAIVLQVIDTPSSSASPKRGSRAGPVERNEADAPLSGETKCLAKQTQREPRRRDTRGEYWPSF